MTPPQSPNEKRMSELFIAARKSGLKGPIFRREQKEKDLTFQDEQDEGIPNVDNMPIEMQDPLSHLINQDPSLTPLPQNIPQVEPPKDPTDPQIAPAPPEVPYGEPSDDSLIVAGN